MTSIHFCVELQIETKKHTHTHWDFVTWNRPQNKYTFKCSFFEIKLHIFWSYWCCCCCCCFGWIIHCVHGERQTFKHWHNHLYVVIIHFYIFIACSTVYKNLYKRIRTYVRKAVPEKKELRSTCTAHMELWRNKNELAVKTSGNSLFRKQKKIIFYILLFGLRHYFSTHSFVHVLTHPLLG